MARIQPARPALASSADLLGAYDRGEYTVVLAELNRRAAELARDKKLADNGDVAAFEVAARQWIATGGPEQATHRRLVAATVALETAHARRSEAPMPSPPFAIWACALMREAPTPQVTRAERLWYLASISALEDLGAWHILRPVVLSEARRRRLWPPEQDEGLAGHLAHARARLPDEPRVQLAEVEAEDQLTTGQSLMAEGLRWAQPDLESHLQLRSDVVTPEVKAALKHHADTRYDPLRRPAATMLNDLDALSAVAQEYLALEDVTDLRAEMEVRFAYVQARLFHWEVAADRLAGVPSLTHDPLLLYWSHYVRGWALQHAGRPDEATAAYRAALVIVPNVPAVTALLAGQLFLTDNSPARLEAYRLLDTTIQMEPPADPWLLYWAGDGRRWPELIGQLREALK